MVLEVWRGNEQVFYLSFDSAQLDHHIAEMVRLRAGLSTALPASPPPRMTAQVDPRWILSRATASPGQFLGLRHPGLGWLGFVFPDHEAAKIAQWLTSSLARNVPAAPQAQPHREAGPAQQGSSPGGGNAAWQGYGTGPGGGGDGHGL